MNTQQHLARIGATAAICGSVLLLLATSLHPHNADPNDPAAAFAEYAADPIWVVSHVGQFLGIAILAVALVGLAASIESGKPAAWSQVGVVGAAASVAVAAVLQAVDGVALKGMVTRWAASAGGDAQQRAFDAALAVRYIEIGLTSFASLTIGLTIIAFGIALVTSSRYPGWLGWVGVVGGVFTFGGGLTIGYTGFSRVAMTVSMSAGPTVLCWAVLIGIFMWRLAPQLESDAVPVPPD